MMKAFHCNRVLHKQVTSLRSSTILLADRGTSWLGYNDGDKVAYCLEEVGGRLRRSRMSWRGDTRARTADMRFNVILHIEDFQKLDRRLHILS